jgi:hypothetical protein
MHSNIFKSEIEHFTMRSSGITSVAARESAGEPRRQGVHQHRPGRPRDVPRQVGRAAASCRQETAPGAAAGRERGATTDSTQQAGGATQEQGPRDQQDFEQAPTAAATTEDLNTHAHLVDVGPGPSGKRVSYFSVYVT